jgi:hypothetical protein
MTVTVPISRLSNHAIPCLLNYGGYGLTISTDMKVDTAAEKTKGTIDERQERQKQAEMRQTGNRRGRQVLALAAPSNGAPAPASRLDSKPDTAPRAPPR